MSTQEIRLDDLDGTPTWKEKVEKVDFGLYGKQYTIDLKTSNRRRLEGLLQEFIDGGQPAVDGDLSDPELLFDADDEALEEDEDAEDDEDLAAESERSDRDLGVQERNEMHIWVAERDNRKRAYGPVSKANIRAYDEAHQQ